MAHLARACMADSLPDSLDSLSKLMSRLADVTR